MTTPPPRASIWLGLAQLLLPKEYKRIEEIRKLRHERKKKTQKATEAQTTTAAAATNNTHTSGGAVVANIS
ncbi:hypothetical protein PV08_03541 [Exophiala spinifera]|uniref:Uncharacterized protein n=1 Tax=Exophiala spinifera TaxID=91928 RepID=A0A0D2A2T1_9EURO|nr:uncharacterized protein PV08_03541 [Exophiala spinifera]KIW19247.1 hypothetical protein PV08_03541 [Exophiala spinifera]